MFLDSTIHNFPKFLALDGTTGSGNPGGYTLDIVFFYNCNTATSWRGRSATSKEYKYIMVDVAS